MKTRILIIAALLLLIGSSAKSQSDDGGFSFGIRAGVDLQNFNGKDMNGDKLNFNLVPRFNVGIVADIPLVTDFYFQPGLFLKTKGAKTDNSFLGINMNAKYNLSYIELPISLLFKPRFGDGHIFLGLGPYVAYGIGGKAKFDIQNVTTEAKIVYQNKYESLNPAQWKYFRPFDFGGNFFFGLELENGVTFQLNTQLGMAKINSKNTSLTGSDAIFRNTGFGLALGYNF